MVLGPGLHRNQVATSPERPNNVDITSVSRIHKIKENPEHKPTSMEAFLDSYSRKSTMRMYRRGLQLFSEWYQKDIETILRERKDDLTPRPDESLVDAKQRADRFERKLLFCGSRLLSLQALRFLAYLELHP